MRDITDRLESALANRYALGAERLPLEIEIAADLTHPKFCRSTTPERHPAHFSATSCRTLKASRSVRNLVREGELPIAEAVRIPAQRGRRTDRCP